MSINHAYLIGGCLVFALFFHPSLNEFAGLSAEWLLVFQSSCPVARLFWTGDLPNSETLSILQFLEKCDFRAVQRSALCISARPFKRIFSCKISFRYSRERALYSLPALRVRIVCRDVNRCALLVLRPSWKHFRAVCFPSFLVRTAHVLIE